MIETVALKAESAVGYHGVYACGCGQRGAAGWPAEVVASPDAVWEECPKHGARQVGVREVIR